MNLSKLTPSTILLLTLPPLLWSGNAIVGQILKPYIAPVTINLIRWIFASIILLPFAYKFIKQIQKENNKKELINSIKQSYKPFAIMGLLGIACYNSLQYMALKTSSPINVTLVAASMPIWMMIIGFIFFKIKINSIQIIAAIISIAGVLTVITRGEITNIQKIQFVTGDILMLLAACCWAGYSWLLIHAKIPAILKQNWATFLLIQILYGIIWSGAATMGEWHFDKNAIFNWQSYKTWAGLIFIAIGPAVLAYRFWGLGVSKAGPTIAAFFANLTPLFTAILSAAILGTPPQTYHGAAFLLILAGIILSSRK